MYKDKLWRHTLHPLGTANITFLPWLVWLWASSEPFSRFLIQARGLLCFIRQTLYQLGGGEKELLLLKYCFVSICGDSCIAELYPLGSSNYIKVIVNTLRQAHIGKPMKYQSCHHGKEPVTFKQKTLRFRLKPVEDDPVLTMGNGSNHHGLWANILV